VAIFDHRELCEQLSQLRRFLHVGKGAVQVGGVAFVAVVVIPAVISLWRTV
jgi:hypothetical protein